MPYSRVQGSKIEDVLVIGPAAEFARVLVKQTNEVEHLFKFLVNP